MSKKVQEQKLEPAECLGPPGAGDGDGMTAAHARREGDEGRGYTVYVYCGPTLPGGRMNANMILRGTRAEIRAAYRDVFEDYPQAERLVVPVCKVADTKRRIRAGGNLYGKYYNDVASAAGKKGETK